MTLAEFTDYVLGISAQAGAEPTASPVLDSQMVIEFLLPVVLREVTRRAFRDKTKIQHFLKFHQLSLTSQSADLPAGVEEEFGRGFQVGLSNADLGLFSYYPDYFDFIRETNFTLPIFTVRDKKIFVKRSVAIPDATILWVYAPTVPQIPLLATDQIPIGEQAMDEALILTSSIVRGNVPLTAVGLTDVMMARTS